MLVWKNSALAIKAQYFVMAAIILSLISIFMGGPGGDPTAMEWFVEESSTRSDLGPRMSFSQVFAIFFPAVTGIMAGVSMSGDLKDARRSLPRGTLFAILTGFIVYLAIPVFLAMNYSLDEMRADKNLVFRVAAVEQLVYVGLWGATLSSAMGSILSAPRTVQALAMDGLMPKFLAKV